MKYHLTLLISMLAVRLLPAQRWQREPGIYKAFGQAYEVKGEFSNGMQITSSCGCLTTTNAVKIPGGPFDCRVNEAGDIYCKNRCDENATCNTWNGTAWVTSNCCYYYFGRKEEQCIAPLPPISYFKITRQFFQA